MVILNFVKREMPKERVPPVSMFNELYCGTVCDDK